MFPLFVPACAHRSKSAWVCSPCLLLVLISESNLSALRYRCLYSLRSPAFGPVFSCSRTDPYGATRWRFPSPMTRPSTRPDDLGTSNIPPSDSYVGKLAPASYSLYGVSHLPESPERKMASITAMFLTASSSETGTSALLRTALEKTSP